MLGVTGLCALSASGRGSKRGRRLIAEGEWGTLGATGRWRGMNPGPGKLILGFGMVRVNLFRDSRRGPLPPGAPGQVDRGGGRDLAGVIWTAGFLYPSSVQSASVLLQSRVPVEPAGRQVGAGPVIVASSDALCVGGTWLALGVRTGIWRSGGISCIPADAELRDHLRGLVAAGGLRAQHIGMHLGSILSSLRSFLRDGEPGRHAVVALPSLWRRARPHSTPRPQFHHGAAGRMDTGSCQSSSLAVSCTDREG